MSNMSNLQAIAFALIPGMAETLGHISIEHNNADWVKMTQQVKNSRNMLYTGIAVAALNGLVHAMSSPGSGGTIFTIIGLGASCMITVVAAKHLYNATKQIQQQTNAGHRP